MKYKLVVIIFCSFLLACDNELDVSAPYRDIPVVYGLIDKNESFQYIRIQKVFQNTSDTKASEVAKISDSLYLRNLAVSLIVGTDTVKCSLTNEFNKEEGIFANDVNYLYKSAAYDWKTKQNLVVKLFIKDTVTGNIFDSKCTIIGDQDFGTSRKITINRTNNTSVSLRYTLNTTANILDAAIRFYYWEKKKSNPADSIRKYYDYYVQSNEQTSKLTPSVTRNTSSRTLLSAWEQFFSTQPQDVVRRFSAIDFIVWGSGPEIPDLLERSKPNGSVVQKNVNYSNINNGLGIFAARTTTVLSNLEFTDEPNTDSSRIIISQLPTFIR